MTLASAPHHILTVTVENKPGVLSRVAGLFSRRAFNIVSLAVSPTDDDAFRLIESTIAEAFPDAVPAPYVMMAATDSRFFTAICKRVYRYTPFRMTRAQRQAIHSYDEHIDVEAFAEGVLWYQRLLERLPEGPVTA